MRLLPEGNGLCKRGRASTILREPSGLTKSSAA